MEELTKAEIPKWLNTEFFTEIVEKDLKLKREEFDVTITSIKPAVGKGENYMSMMYRIVIEIKTKTNIEVRSIIIKSLVDTIPMAKEFGIFDKEIQVYAAVIPALESEYERVGEVIQFGPKCLKTTSDPTDLIVLNDLSCLGYKMGDRRVGLDLNHAKLFITKLAKFHAASATYVEKNGNFDNRLHENMFNEKSREIFQKFFTNAVPYFEEALVANGIETKYIDKIVSCLLFSFF